MKTWLKANIGDVLKIGLGVFLGMFLTFLTFAIVWLLWIGLILMGSA